MRSLIQACSSELSLSNRFVEIQSRFSARSNHRSPLNGREQWSLLCTSGQMMVCCDDAVACSLEMASNCLLMIMEDIIE